MEVDSSSNNLELLRDFIAATLGHNTEITDFSRESGRKSVTWRVQAQDGAAYFMKQHEFRHHYQAEVVALTEWVPKLESSDRWSAPEVVANSTELGAVIITELPGEILEEASTSLDERIEMYRIAGWLAAQIHRFADDAREPDKSSSYGRKFFQRYIELASPYVDAETLNWVAELTAGDDLFNGQQLVPTHCDYSPRNWLIQRSRNGISLGLIDWERGRASYWLEDAQRMARDHWLKEPELREAFFDGYGRKPSAEEERQLNIICLANAIGSIPWSIDHGDDRFAEFGRRTLAKLRSELS